MRVLLARVQALAVESCEAAGAACVDEILAHHFKPEIESKHGDGVCSSPKSRFRMRKACERYVLGYMCVLFFVF